MKKCTKCGIIKHPYEFHKNKFIKDGLRIYCKECVKSFNKRKEPATHQKEQKKAYNKEYGKKYRKENKQKINLRNSHYVKEKRLNDPLFKLRHNLRISIVRCIRSKSHNKYITKDVLGCEYSFFIKYIESQFEEWMSWDNYGKYNGSFYFGWDLDHIIPISSAQNEKDILSLNHYTNLKPLCSKMNRDIKRNKTMLME